MSSIEPYEEGETQLFIANSIEVRSDEICAESVLSADDLVRVSKAAKLDAVSGSRSMHTVVCSQKDCSTAANTIQFRRHSHNTRHGSNYKSNCAASSSNAAGFLHKSQPTSCHSDAEDRASNKHTGSVQKRAYLHSDSVVSNSGGFPPKQNDILKSSSQKTEVEICCIISFDKCEDLYTGTSLQQPVPVNRDVSADNHERRRRM